MHSPCFWNLIASVLYQRGGAISSTPYLSHFQNRVPSSRREESATIEVISFP